MSDPQDTRPAVQRHAGKISAATIAAAILIATPFIASREGDGGKVGYRDIVGVVTSCYGHTGKGAVYGKRYTGAECKGQLADDVKVKADKIAQCIKVDVPTKSFAAFLSFSFNVGSAGFCRSTVARDLNAGHLRAACTDMGAWVYAGGKRVQGLANRRASEVALCLSGVPR